MPAYHVTIKDHAGTTVLVQVHASDKAQATEKARYAQQLDKTIILGEVLEVVEVAP